MIGLSVAYALANEGVGSTILDRRGDWPRRLLGRRGADPALHATDCRRPDDRASLVGRRPVSRVVRCGPPRRDRHRQRLSRDRRRRRRRDRGRRSRPADRRRPLARRGDRPRGRSSRATSSDVEPASPALRSAAWIYRPRPRPDPQPAALKESSSSSRRCGRGGIRLLWPNISACSGSDRVRRPSRRHRVRTKRPRCVLMRAASSSRRAPWSGRPARRARHASVPTPPAQGGQIVLLRSGPPLAD